MAVISNSSGYYDPRYWDKQDRYEQEMRAREIQRQMEMARNAYNPYTDTYGGVTAQQIQEGVKPKPMPTPEYLNNKNLLLLGEAP